MTNWEVSERERSPSIVKYYGTPVGNGDWVGHVGQYLAYSSTDWQGNDECGAVGGMIGRGMMSVEQSVE
jgi:hypothetical protein